MSQPEATFRSTDPGDEILARVLEEITQEVEAGQGVDLGKYEAKYPQYAQRIRELVPAAEALGGLGFSLVQDSRSGSRPPQATFAVSGTLGDFRIVREIGRGGMGVVYEAEQMSLHRRVALKMLPFAAVMDSRQLQRFQNEAVAAASLKHPNIVQVYSVGCERGVHYYAMEYVEGQTLAQVIQRLRQSDRAPKTEAAAKKQDKKGSNEKGKPERAKPARAAAKSSA